MGILTAKENLRLDWVLADHEDQLKNLLPSA
jgi:hypothetical protein